MAGAMILSNSKCVADYLRGRFICPDVEEFWSLALNPGCELLAAKMLFRGTVDCCLIHPRDVFRFALQTNATTLVVGHNHPSGNCEPSRADIAMTKKLRAGGELLQIPVVDHVIVGAESHFSFADRFRKL
jgi:DNA repair protein RadC